MTELPLTVYPPTHRAPGPAWYEIIKTAVQFRQRPLEFFRDLKARYGDFVRFQLGPFTAYMVTNPDDVASVLTQTDIFYRDKLIRMMAEPFFGTGLGLSDGPLHRRNRKLVSPAFYHSRLKLYAGVMAERVQRLVESWHNGQEISLEPTMAKLTLGIIAKAMFNVDLEASPELLKALDTLLVKIGGKLREAIPLPYFIPTKANRDIVKAVKQVDDLATRIIDEHIARGEDQGNLLSMLIKAVDENGERLSREQIRSEVMVSIVAGHESPAHVLTWTFYLLSKHPEILEKMEAEFDSILQGRFPTVNDLEHLPFTEMVLKESLRLYPVFWLTGREPICDTTIGKYQVKKGDLIFMSPYITQRDPANFDDPLAFRPERFANNPERKWKSFKYFPFGGGSHICIGREFAMIEMMLTLAAVVGQSRLQLLDTSDVGIIPGATMHPDRPLIMRINKRTRNSIQTHIEYPVFRAAERIPDRCPVAH